MIRSHTPPSVLHQFGGFEWIVFMVVFLVMLGLVVYFLTTGDGPHVSSLRTAGTDAAATRDLPREGCRARGRQDLQEAR